MYKAYGSWMKKGEHITFQRYSQMMTWYDSLCKNNPMTRFTYTIENNSIYITMKKR